MPQDINDIAHEFGHDVPGFLSGELLGGDPMTKMRVSRVMLAMLQEIAKLRSDLASCTGRCAEIADSYVENNPPDVCDWDSCAERVAAAIRREFQDLK